MEKSGGGRAGDRDCALGRCCSLLTADQNVPSAGRFVYGAQHDVEEALRHLVRLWDSAGPGGCLQGRPGFARLGIGDARQLFSVVTDARSGCFAEISPGVRCLSVSSKLEEEMMVRVVLPPGTGYRETRVRWQLENFGTPEHAPERRCDRDEGGCGQVGACANRQFLARVGPLLLVQLSVYDLATRTKLNNVRIHADERMTLRVGGNACVYELVAAVEHIGRSLSSGHYICFRRCAGNEWLVLNDDGRGQVRVPGPSHGSRLNSRTFAQRQMFLCMYARSESGVAFPPVAPSGDDEQMGAGSSEIVDVDPTVRSMADDDALAVAAERLSLASAEEAELATAIQRSMEESNTLGRAGDAQLAGSPSTKDVSVAASKTSQLGEGAGAEQSQEFERRRILRRQASNAGLVEQTRLPLRRHMSMSSDDESDLPPVFERLRISREDASALGSTGRSSSSAAPPTDPPHGLPPVLEEKDEVPSGRVVSSGSSSSQGLHQSAHGGGTSRLGSIEEEKGEDDAAGGESVGSAAVHELDWRPFTPSIIDPSKCMARTWAGGRGGQCTKTKLAGQRYCTVCSKKLAHGAVDGPIPEKKLIEFKNCAKKLARGGGGMQAGSAGGVASVAANSRGSVVSAQEPVGGAGATRPSRVGASMSSRVPRRTEIADMKDILAENQYVEHEMERREFQRPEGQWVGGRLLPDDPPNDADLEAFLRRQFQAQQDSERARDWGPGRALGRE